MVPALSYHIYESGAIGCYYHSHLLLHLAVIEIPAHPLKAVMLQDFLVRNSIIRMLKLLLVCWNC